MTVPADVFYIVAAISAAWDARRRASRVLAVIAGVFLLGFVIDVSVHWPTVQVRFAAMDIVLGVAASVLLLDVVGLPASIGTRIRIGLHSGEWEFDRAFYRQIQQLDRLLATYPATRTLVAYEAWQRTVAAKAPPIIERIESMIAPDDEWAALVKDYATLYRGIIDRILAGERPDNDSVASEGRALFDRREDMRAKYRDHASRLLHLW